MDLLKIFIKKEKKTDLNLEIEEMNDEIETLFLKDFIDSSLICSPVEDTNREVI